MEFTFTSPTYGHVSLVDTLFMIIDPRPKSAPYAIVGLVIAFGIFFMIMYALYAVLEWNQWVGIPLVMLFVQRSVLFKPPSN